MKNCTFSILMASYNNGKYIETAINSIISQTYPNWELIIVDDCSPDNSNDIIKKYLKDGKIKLIQHKYNQGYGGALRTAASIAKNQIIGIVDSDDKLHENALREMNNAYNKYVDYGFIYSTMWICDTNLKNCKLDKVIKTVVPEKTFIFNPHISHFKTFKKEFYEKTSGFDSRQERAVDKDIIYKLEEVTRFRFINIPLYYYREHNEGISQGKNLYKARLFRFYAKYKTYKRRLNTPFPNFTRRDIFIEYCYCTFYRLIWFIIKAIIALRVSNLIKNLFNKLPNIKLKQNLMLIKRKHIDLF